MRTHAVVRRLILPAICLAVAVALLWPSTGHGVRATVFDTSGDAPRQVSTAIRPGFDLDDLSALGGRIVPPGDLPFSVVWAGGLMIPRAGFYAVDLDGDGDLELVVDGAVLQAQTAGTPAARRVVWLERGLRQVDLTYARTIPNDTAPAVHVALGPLDGSVQPVQPAALFTPTPSPRPWATFVATARDRIGAIAWPLLLVAAAFAADRIARAVGRRAPGTRWTFAPWVLRAATLTALALVVAYAALLRFDAIAMIYGPVERPQWLRAAQQSRDGRSLLRPDAVTWPPHDGERRYISDPYTYLQYAEDMQSFYAAHRREPVFPLVTKIWLWLLSHQDVAVSFASASFGVLAVLATYLLGAAVWSVPVGLGAALAVAIECDIVTWSVGGWRDDAFTCAVLVSTYAMVRYLRAPTMMKGVAIGLVAGAACLIRITSLSFVLPGLAYLFFASTQPWRARVAQLGFAAVAMSIVVAPFLYNCWRVYGDPLYSINVHADVYRVAEGERDAHGAGAAEYLAGKWRTRPFDTLDTVVMGLTEYPFANKWQGFEPWMPGVGRWLAIAAVVGLMMLATASAGRLLLLMLATSLIPFAFTWKVLSDWRFTEHVYPMFLIGAAVAMTEAVRAVVLPRMLVARANARRPALVFALIIAGVFAGYWVVTRVLPPLIVEESLMARQDVTIGAGGRDGAFFGRGWSPVLAEGNVTARVARDATASVTFPLPKVVDYDLTVRLDPFPRPFGATLRRIENLEVFANDRLVATTPLTWNPARVGSYQVHLPRDVVRQGANQLRLAVKTAAPEAAGLLTRPDSSSFRLWYLRVRPTE